MGFKDDGEKKRVLYVSIRNWSALPLVVFILICSLCGTFYLNWSWAPAPQPNEFASTASTLHSDVNQWSIDFVDTREMPEMPFATKKSGPRFSSASGANATQSGAAVQTRLAPLRLEMKLCGDFPEQQFQIISTILIGVLLGAQVVLPQNFAEGDLEFSWMFDVDRLQLLGQSIYTKYWCVRRKTLAHGLWCSSAYVPGILTQNQFLQLETMAKTSGRSIQEVDISQLVRKMAPTHSKKNLRTTFVDLPKISEKIWYSHFSSLTETEMLEGNQFVVINDKHGCHLYKHLKATEPDVSHRLFWDIYEILEFNSAVYGILRHLKMNLAQHFASVANDRAISFGYPMATNVAVVVLESQDHCSELDHSDHCFDIGNTMLSEGVPPSNPVYLRSAETAAELNRTVLGTIYTVVTKDMLVQPSVYFHNNIIWSAVEHLMAADAISVIGPSSSMFSSLILLARRRLDKAAFHYDGKMTLLEAEGILRPAKSTVEILRYPIKWVFSVGKRHRPSIAWNMSIAAVKSAAVANVVPVCLTNAGPDSELVQLLIRMGVRVLHHTPKWHAKSKAVLNQWRAKSDRRWIYTFPKFGDIQGMLMRIDIPVVGLLDRLVLYTDIDILFQQPVDWETMLGNSTLFTEENITYAKPGAIGLPRFFAMSTEFVQSSDREKMDTGVMLMNLVNLRKTHQEFVNFLFDENRTWKYSTSDPTGYKAYYRRNGKLEATFLPYRMNWKVFWDGSKKSDVEQSLDPIIVHFHGPKCETGIQPFLSEGIVQDESFRPLLEQCISLDSKCFRYCRQYEWFLFEHYKQIKWNPKVWSTAR